MGAILLVIALFVLSATFGESSTEQYRELSTRELAVEVCTTDMATEFHIHPLVSIFINGEKQTLPEGIGLEIGCMHSLHTHDGSGKIHVEAPVQRDFTLGDFFAVWGEPFNREGYSVKMTVNGRENTEFENLILEDGNEIVIYYEEIGN